MLKQNFHPRCRLKASRGLLIVFSFNKNVVNVLGNFGRRLDYVV